MYCTNVEKFTRSELRDPVAARRFLVQGLWCQRVMPPAAAHVRPALGWALEAASAGQQLPPIGFLSDLGHLLLGLDLEARPARSAIEVPSVPIHLLRTYEDHVLGKIYADWTFTEAGDALRRYQGAPAAVRGLPQAADGREEQARNQARGLAFLLNQFQERSEFPGVEMSPSIIKTALETAPEELLAEGFDSLQQEGVDPVLLALYEGLIAAARRMAEMLGPADLFELKHGYCLQPEGERLARRQVLHAAELLEAALHRGRHAFRPPARRREVPTHILDEDTYPVGGFTSLSTRGSPESLLHSQLAYMETDERPDLFDIKFLRDELLYYARDENQFLRRRRTFVFVLLPDLVQARFKDSALPYQRGVLLLALIVAVVRKLTEWLSADALTFQVLFPAPADANPPPLAPEMELLKTLLPEPIANGSLVLKRVRPDEPASLCAQWARRSLVHGLVCGTSPEVMRVNDCAVGRLEIAGPRPALADSDQAPALVEGEDAADSWGKALEQVLAGWV
jgi:hypothetical protein